jgi:hypothetical protein
MKKNCPHCYTELKLAKESHKETPKGVTDSKVWKCTVSDCKYSYTESIVTEDGE